MKNDLKSVFQSMICYSVQGEVNEVIICSINKNDDDGWKNILQKAVSILNEQVYAKRLSNDVKMFDLSSFFFL